MEKLLKTFEKLQQNNLHEKAKYLHVKFGKAELRI